MSLLFAAIGATVTALVEVTLGQYIVVGDATPHPVLVGGVIWTIAAGIDRGITWAFVGGLVLDSLLGRPSPSDTRGITSAMGPRIRRDRAIPNRPGRVSRETPGLMVSRR